MTASPLTAMTHKPWHLPLRLATGVFIANSGLSKRGVPPEAAQGMQGMAVTAFPQLGKMDPEQFAKLLSSCEIALGAALLVPLVPSGLAGLGLTGFAAALTRMYLAMPGWRQEGSVLPTTEGTGFAKDMWLLGIGLALVIDALTDRG